jgi:hypothetical protein
MVFKIPEVKFLLVSSAAGKRMLQTKRPLKKLN